MLGFSQAREESIRIVDLERENRALRRRLATLTQEAANNDAILKRSLQREIDLLQAESIEDLLRVLVDGLKNSYQLDAVTLFLCDPDRSISHLMVSDGVSPDNIPNVHFADVLTGLAPQFAGFTRPWLGAYRRLDHGLIFPDIDRLGSVALIPLLSRQRQAVGSLNFGSADPMRFTRKHASDFLSRLGAFASFCLENTINRAKLVRTGMTDVLTGWRNRRYFEDRLQGELARASRNQQPVACMLLDVDHFKEVNDRYGHLSGDIVLREIARRAQAQVRASDVAARFGGDEFAVLLPNTTIDEARILGERVRKSVCRTPIELSQGSSLAVTVCIGLAEFEPAPKSSGLQPLMKRLLAEADAALYQAKSAGRNRTAISGSRG